MRVWFNLVDVTRVLDIQAATAENWRGRKKERRKKEEITAAKFNGLSYIGRPQLKHTTT